MVARSKKPKVPKPQRLRGRGNRSQSICAQRLRADRNRKTKAEGPSGQPKHPPKASEVESAVTAREAAKSSELSGYVPIPPLRNFRAPETWGLHLATTARRMKPKPPPIPFRAPETPPLSCPARWGL